MIFIINKIDEIEKRFGIKGKLLSKSRKMEVVRVRSCLYYYFRHDKKMTYSEIAKIFNRDHSTVVFMYFKTKDWIENPNLYPLIPETYKIIKNIFENE